MKCRKFVQGFDEGDVVAFGVSLFWKGPGLEKSGGLVMNWNREGSRLLISGKGVGRLKILGCPKLVSQWVEKRIRS